MFHPMLTKVPERDAKQYCDGYMLNFSAKDCGNGKPGYTPTEHANATTRLSIGTTLFRHHNNAQEDPDDEQGGHRHGQASKAYMTHMSPIKRAEPTSESKNQPLSRFKPPAPFNGANFEARDRVMPRLNVLRK
jgi:hypothetical protein